MRRGSSGSTARRSGRDRPVRPARSVASAKPIGSSPLIRSRPPHGRSGRAERSPACSRAICSARPASAIACSIRASSSARCSGVSEFISRCIAAARCASESISSSRLAGLSGKKSPYCLHELGELLGRVLAARVGVEHVVERVHHVAHALHVLLVGVGQGVAHAGELRVEQLAAQQVLDLLVLLRGLGRAPLVLGELLHGPGGVRAAARRARPRPCRALSDGSGNSAPRSASSASSSSCAGLLERAVEPVVAAQLARPAHRPLAQRVQAVAAVRARAQQPVQRVARR